MKSIPYFSGPDTEEKGQKESVFEQFLQSDWILVDHSQDMKEMSRDMSNMFPN